MTREEVKRIFEDLREHKITLSDLSVNEQEEICDMAISALSAEGEWIPVTEETELPEHDVICCNNEGDIALGYLYFDEEENQIACDHDPYVMVGVVAYMELPEPYKAEKGGE